MTIQWRFLLLLTALAPAGCRTGDGQAAVEAAAADSARAVLDAFAAAVNAGDWQAAGALYADDPAFHWMEEGRLAYPSADSARRALQALGTRFEARLALSDVRALALGPDAAVVSALFRQMLTPAEGTPFSFAGAFTMTVRRMPEGWRILTGHTSTLRTP